MFVAFLSLGTNDIFSVFRKVDLQSRLRLRQTCKRLNDIAEFRQYRFPIVPKSHMYLTYKENIWTAQYFPSRNAIEKAFADGDENSGIVPFNRESFSTFYPHTVYVYCEEDVVNEISALAILQLKCEVLVQCCHVKNFTVVRDVVQYEDSAFGLQYASIPEEFCFENMKNHYCLTVGEESSPFRFSEVTAKFLDAMRRDDSHNLRRLDIFSGFYLAHNRIRDVMNPIKETKELTLLCKLNEEHHKCYHYAMDTRDSVIFVSFLLSKYRDYKTKVYLKVYNWQDTSLYVDLCNNICLHHPIDMSLFEELMKKTPVSVGGMKNVIKLAIGTYVGQLI